MGQAAAAAVAGRAGQQADRGGLSKVPELIAGKPAAPARARNFGERGNQMAGVKGRSGGAREGAGRKPAPPRKTRAKGYMTDDPDEFLRAVMKDPNADFKDRMAAALALKKGTKGAGSLGKKEEAAEAARKVMGQRSLAPVPPPCRPRLVAVK